MSDPAPPLRVVIIGAGFSGTLVAIHLLKQNPNVQIDLVDSRLPGRGLAYSTAWDQHLLNVPAVRMSAFGKEPMHFLNWLHANGHPGAQPDTFAPRRLYGSYLQSVLESSIRESSIREASVRQADPRRTPCPFRHHFAQATRVWFDGDSVRVPLDNGEQLRCAKVVLASGNPPPRPVGSRLPGYYGSPWEPGAIENAGSEGDVLLIGAGLTAVDAFLALRAQGHTGAVHLVSRRGKLPHAHQPYRPLPEPFRPSGSMGARSLLRAIRRKARASEADGTGWRALIDSLRPVTNDIWNELELTEKRRVLRHCKTWWDIHRHRMAPEIGDQIAAAQRDGILRTSAGRVKAIAPVEAGLQATLLLRTGKSLVLGVGRVINCTGSDEDYARTANPALRSLLQSEHITPGEIGKGLRTDEHGALLNGSGNPSDWLFTLGPPRIGGLFETTAVPELRKQAEALAAYLSAVVFEPVEVSPALFIAAGI